MSDTNGNPLKRYHKKPYKVGNLYFGRTGSASKDPWVVSASVDLSAPMAKFEAGKLARTYCEERRDEAKAEKASKKIGTKGIRRGIEPDAGDGSPADGSAEIDVNIPPGSGLTRILDGDQDDGEQMV